MDELKNAGLKAAEIATKAEPQIRAMEALKVSVIDVICPKCHASPGVICLERTAMTTVRMTTFHPERVDKFNECNQLHTPLPA